MGMGTEEFTWCEMPGITDIQGMFSGGLEVLFSKSSPIAVRVPFPLRRQTVKLSQVALFL